VGSVAPDEGGTFNAEDTERAEAAEKNTIDRAGMVGQELTTL
jgi:hypothetical protein